MLNGILLLCRNEHEKIPAFQKLQGIVVQKYVRRSSHSRFAIHEQGKLLPCDVAVLAVGVLYAVAAEFGRVLLYLGQVVGLVRVGVHCTKPRPAYRGELSAVLPR